MPFTTISSAQRRGLSASLVSVEVDLSRGLHSLSIIGLPDKGIEESKDRISSAIKNSGFKSPKQANIKTVISLAPADVRKEGPSFDVPMALGYLLAAGDISFEPEGKMFVGELALDGSLRPVKGAISYARLAREKGLALYLPERNLDEATMIPGVHIYPAGTLRELVEHLQGARAIPPAERGHGGRSAPERKARYLIDEIAGNEHAKRAVCVAIAGRHNLLLYGPPGTGKTLLARAAAELMPDMTESERIEVAEIYSAAELPMPDLRKPPFRAPHHTATYAAIVGGSALKPGEISLAHRGMLFMDEFPEFDKRVIESLRQPLEERKVAIARAGYSATYPAAFALIAAMNLCPCGNKGTAKACVCSAKDIQRYERRLSGPILDRIDMWVEISSVDYSGALSRERTDAASESIIRSIARARDAQIKRFSRRPGGISSNGEADATATREAMMPAGDAKAIIERAAEKHRLSIRAIHRLLRLSRTIADLEGSENVEAPHVLEALQYRKRF